MVDLDKVINKLISLSSNKYNLLADILVLTEKQTSVIDVNDIDGLNLLIDRKQECLDSIKQLDIQFEAIVSDLKVLYDVDKIDDLEVHCVRVLELKQCINRVMNLVREICKVEDVNKEKILKSKDELEKKISNASRGRHAIKQYGNFSAKADAYFIDKSK